LGSSIAFGLGCIAVIAGPVGIVQYGDDAQMSFLKGGTLLAGMVMILGALAYHSAKERKLGEARWVLTRRVLEVALIVLICVMVLTQNGLMHRIASDPVPNAIIPIWAIVAYLIIAFLPARFVSKRRGSGVDLQS
jgi:hypothetical protein